MAYWPPLKVTGAILVAIFCNSRHISRHFW